MHINKLMIFLIGILATAIFTIGDSFAQYKNTQVDWGIHPPAHSAVGQAGWQFLKLPATARYAAVGGITTSLSHGDASTVLANPASIADVKDIGVSFSSMNWIADIKYQSASFVKNMREWGSFGVKFIYLDYGDMMRTENVEQFDEAGNSLGRTSPTLGLGTFSGGDIAIGLCYARQITDRLQVGGSLNYLREELDNAATSNWTIDIGTTYYTGIKTLRLSMIGRNFGPDAEFAKYDERIAIPAVQVPMPMVFLFGVAYDVFEGGDKSPHLLTVAAEFTHPNDGNEKVHVGAEYSYHGWIRLRGGYRFNYDEEGLTIGGGLKLHTNSFGLLIDYAYLDYGRLNMVQMVSVGFEL